VDFPFAKLAEDIAADRPSGVDLEMEGDAEFMRFTAQIEGVLPQSFASFDRAEADLPAHIADVGALLARSKDLRLAAAAAKLFILNRDLSGFEKAVSAVAQWLEERWEQIFPELIDGDPIMRSVALLSLDDIPHTVKPLEAAPLFRSRRAGAVSLRAALLAEGRIAPRQGEGDDEKPPTPGDIAAAIREADIAELVEARDGANRLLAAVARIEALWDEKTGDVGTLSLANLKPKAQEISAFLERAIVSRDPALALQPQQQAEAESDGGTTDHALLGAVATFADACAAMEAADRYFRRKEPSSPVRLVLAQARALIGKSFYESLEQLVPDLAARASVPLGRNLPMTLPLERLASLMANAEEPDDDGADGSETALSPDVEVADGSGPDSETSEEESGEAAAPAAPAERAPKRFAAASRNAALDLLDQAAAYFVATEPSSAIPMILDIAKSSAGRDFMALLRESLPAHAFRVDE